MKTIKKTKYRKILKLLASTAATVLLLGALTGCGAPQPPMEGNCHPWREWVPPQQNEEGEWQSGYCRDTGE